MNPDLTPDNFKAGVMAAHPEYAKAVASDGTPYASMDATDFTTRFAQKYPDATTKSGNKYSDYLPKQNTQPQQKEGLLSKIGHGALGLLNTIEKPFIGAASIPVQALAKLTGQPDPYAKGFPGLAGSKIDVTPLDLEKKAGDIAQVGSYFVPGEGLLGATGMGVLQGAGSAMSQGGDLAQVATGGAEGGIVAGATAGLTKLAGAGLSKAGEMLSGEGFTKATEGIKNAYSSALNLNAAERGFESRSGKDLAQVLMDNGASLGRSENGTLDASGAIEKLQEKLNPLNEQATQVLTKPQGIVKNVALTDIASSVEKRIRGLNINPTEQKAAIALMKQYISDTGEQFGAEVTPEVADRIKQLFQGSAFKKALTSSDQLQGNVSYLMSDEMRKATEQAVAGTDAGDVLGGINKQRSDLIDAIKRLTKLDGVRILKGGRLGNMAGGLVGTIAGAAGAGAPGAIAGDYFGSKAAEFLNNPATKIGIAKGKAKVAGILPGLLGQSAEPIGKGISAVGAGVKKLARPAGLLGNVLTQSQ